MANPITDFWDFLIGNTSDQNDLGAWKYLFVALFWALIIASVANRRAQLAGGPLRAHRPAPWHLVCARPRGRHVVSRHALEAAASGLLRPSLLDRANGPARRFRLSSRLGRAALSSLSADFQPGHFPCRAHLRRVADPWARRASGQHARIIFVLHLWLGIYQSGTPAEWPWSYVFLAMVMFMFALHAAGRSLDSMPGSAVT